MNKQGQDLRKVLDISLQSRLKQSINNLNNDEYKRFSIQELYKNLSNSVLQKYNTELEM